MSVFDDMRETYAALKRGDVLTDAQLTTACEAILARPSGYARFAADVIWTLGRRLARCEEYLRTIEAGEGETA
jgi:hypothetical protein